MVHICILPVYSLRVCFLAIQTLGVLDASTGFDHSVNESWRVSSSYLGKVTRHDFPYFSFSTALNSDLVIKFFQRHLSRTLAYFHYWWLSLNLKEPSLQSSAHIAPTFMREVREGGLGRAIMFPFEHPEADTEHRSKAPLSSPLANHGLVQATISSGSKYPDYLYRYQEHRMAFFQGSD
ncbi:hypothetical protein RF11_15357 [Thelohanellus kitauei]|uniref:Uncharacterized protein n=1 Tax=Thelohanellus kitauei TaxID=669202 RepID=A0A0C2M7I1_THEKT|nr:hypothetical protein RF11_15357 [Thelohanellus kitauei]